MATKTKRVKKSPTRKPKKTSPHAADCADLLKTEKSLKRYLDKRLEEQIIPRIDAVDERDKLQFSIASKHLEEYDSILQNQSELLHSQSHVKSEIVRIDERQKRLFEDMVPSLSDSISQLHNKLDAHIEEETNEFLNIRTELTSAAGHVEAIKHTLDNVSANGNKGLSSSLTDLYNKLDSLEKLNTGARARAKLWKVVHDVIDNTWFLRPVKSVWGLIVYFIVAVLVVNTVGHALGLEFNALSLIEKAVEFGKKLSGGH